MGAPWVCVYGKYSAKTIVPVVRINNNRYQPVKNGLNVAESRHLKGLTGEALLLPVLELLEPLTGLIL